jgi:hypothetical protein
LNIQLGKAFPLVDGLFGPDLASFYAVDWMIGIVLKIMCGIPARNC